MHTTIARQQSAVNRLKSLKNDPPQSLLLEGGSEKERVDMALYWAALVNCQSPSAPCLECPDCLQIMERVYLDLFFVDGREESIKIGMIREMKPNWGQPPRGNGFRVTVFNKSENMTVEAANSLLKSLEEPRPGNLFVLTAPQREKLLETLVSRSWVVTLAWPRQAAVCPEAEELCAAMARFWVTRQGWFEHTSAKGAVTTELAEQVVAAIRAELIKIMSGNPSKLITNLDSVDRWSMLDKALDRTTQALGANVNPALALDWLATRFV